MKIKIWAVAITLAFAAFARGATNDLTGLLQQGLFEEEANRNLDAAIANYQSLATVFDKDRQIAATAIFRLGECYRKLGKTNEAVIQYQRIIKEFSDQQALVNLSRQNLTGLGATNSAPQTGESKTPSAMSQQWRQQIDDATAQLAKDTAVLDKLKNMDRSTLRAALPGMVPDTQMDALETQLNQAQQQLIRLKSDYTPDHPKYKNAEEVVDQIHRQIDQRMDGILMGLEAKVEANASYIAQLQARLQDAQTTKPQPTSSPGDVTTDEEQTQIRNIQAMIQNSPDLINAPGPGESGLRTPLQRAAEKGQLVVAKYLVDHGADVNARVHSNEGVLTPLYLAANSGQKAMAELLLARGADVNGASFLNPLYTAVSHGFTGVAEVLIANKADVNARGNDYDKRPLHAAVSNDKTNLIQSLIEHGADVNAPDMNGNAPLHVAATGNKVDAAKILVAAKADVAARDKDGNTPLHVASWNGFDKIVSLLLDSGASVDATNHSLTTPLIDAIPRGNADVVRTLLAHKANPNLNSRTDPNSGLVPPIIYAVSQNKPAIVQMLLEAGANPNGDTNMQERPIFYVSRDNGAPTLKLLLQRGADPNAKNSEDRSALFWITNPELVRLLIEYKADLNARDPFGDTPIMQVNGDAASTNFVKMLADAGAKLDLQDTNGNTALHFAVNRFDPEFVGILLEHKANPNIQNNAGYTPLDIAKARNPGRSSMLVGNGGFGYRGRRPGGTMPAPATPIAASSVTTISLQDVEQKIVDLLVNAGGLENLPKRDRIEARRGANTVTTLSKDSRGSNRFSLLELIADTYWLLSQNREGEWQSQTEKEDFRRNLFNGALRFPDLKNIVIYRRTNASAKQTAIKVDVEEILKTGDCSRDAWLEWGDIVEIPEADHPVEQTWPGLSNQDATALIKCVTREVTIKIKGESTTLKLAPEIKTVELQPDANTTGGPANKLTRASFMLRSVLDSSKLIRVSSDLSHVKVTRIDPETKKKMEWVVDCTNNQQDNLWLRDGDVIDVPEK